MKRYTRNRAAVVLWAQRGQKRAAAGRWPGAWRLCGICSQIACFHSSICGLFNGGLDRFLTLGYNGKLVMITIHDGCRGSYQIKPESKEHYTMYHARSYARGEPASTYFVPDRSYKEELLRLQTQDQMLTAGMGGVLPEQPDPTIFQRVLDVGCGTGGWLIETARTYPNIPVLVGIDISTRMIDYARTIAQEQHVSDRVEFHEMDALQTLAFPADYFDLVNLRLGWSYLRTWDWPKLIEQFQHITRPGGVVRLT